MPLFYSEGKNSPAAGSATDGGKEHSANQGLQDRGLRQESSVQSKNWQEGDPAGAVSADHTLAQTGVQGEAGLYKASGKKTIAGQDVEGDIKLLVAEGKADAKAVIAHNKISVAGTAGASLTFAGASAKIKPSSPLSWTFLGEKLDLSYEIGMSAAALAEVKGAIQVDAALGDQSAALKLGAEGGAEAFAGAKAGVEIGAKLRWHKKKPSEYVNLLGHVMQQFLPDLWKVDDWLVDRSKEAMNAIAPVAFGSAGPADLISLGAGIEGSAGIGAYAKFKASVAPMLEVSGKAGVTFGLGAGAKVKAGLGLINGPLFIGVTMANGMSLMYGWISDYAGKIWAQMKYPLADWIENKNPLWLGDRAAAMIRSVGPEIPVDDLVKTARQAAQQALDEMRNSG